MNTLLIDTSSNKEIVIGLETVNKKFLKRKNIGKLRAQAILPTIDNVLSSAKTDLSSIGSIKVERGPGSFTGLRVGIAVANTLGFFLRVSINGKKVGVIEEPQYA